MHWGMRVRCPVDVLSTTSAVARGIALWGGGAAADWGMRGGGGGGCMPPGVGRWRLRCIGVAGVVSEAQVCGARRWDFWGMTVWGSVRLRCVSHPVGGRGGTRAKGGACATGTPGPRHSCCLVQQPSRPLMIPKTPPPRGGRWWEGGTAVRVGGGGGGRSHVEEVPGPGSGRSPAVHTAVLRGRVRAPAAEQREAYPKGNGGVCGSGDLRLPPGP